MRDADGHEVPQPVTRQDRYLVAIITELSQLRQALSGSATTVDPDEDDVDPSSPSTDDLPDVDAFHVGAGWYEIDGEKIRGRDAALDALRGT